MKVFKKIEDLNIEYYRLFEDKANCIDFLSKKFSKKIDKAILKLNARNRTNAALIYKMINKEWLGEFYEAYCNSLDSRNLLPY